MEGSIHDQTEKYNPESYRCFGICICIVITINGITHSYYPTPSSNKTIVNLENIPKIDLSTLPDVSTNKYVTVTDINN